MKQRFRTALPPLGSDARLPALLLLLLVAAGMGQLVLPDAVPLPDTGASPAFTRAGEGAGLEAPAPMSVVTVPPALAARALFAPVLVAAAEAGPPDPLGGAIIAGSIQHARSRVAVVQMPGARLRYVAPGGLVAGWRIDALDPARARLSRGRERLDIAYGAAAVAPHPTSTKSRPEDEE